MHTNEELLRPKDAARILKIGETKVRELVSNGKLCACYLNPDAGSMMCIRRRDLDAFVESLIAVSPSK
jgi:excisionase family DNA binding protein